MRVGIVCPYSLDVAGGVQAHVLDLARVLVGLGHDVDVLAPASETTPVPPFVTRGGRAVGIPYNGSVARLTFGPASMRRVRRWLRRGIDGARFDVVHLHEPTAPGLSMLALTVLDGPVVATFHTSTPRSRSMRFFEPVLRPLLERVTARIAVSPLARRVYVEHLGGDAVEIPNGVDVGAFAGAVEHPLRPRTGATVGFVGRFTESRKGMATLLDALRPLVDDRPDLRLLVVGRGDADELRRLAGPALAARIDLLGAVDDATKVAALGAMDVLAAPNIGGESFGIVVAEGLAAGVPVAAGDIEAFRHVLDAPDGPAGVLLPPGDAAAWREGLVALLDDPPRRDALAAAGRGRVAAFDWVTVGAEVLRVYDAAVAADPRGVRPVPAETRAPGGLPSGP